jgi:hypothetical protein
MSLHRQLLIICLSLISVSAFISASFWSIQKLLIQPSDHPLLLEQHPAEPTPVGLTLPRQSAALPIIQAPMVNGEWTISSQAVSLLKTESAGQIMYGHNWNSLLGPLTRSQLGESITIHLTNGQAETYRITSKFSVPADRLDVLALANDPNTLLIYTCDGWLDTQRLIVLAQRQPTTVSFITN